MDGRYGSLAWRRGRARKRLRGIELSVIVVVLELFVLDAIGELVVYFLSNDCVSPSSRNQMRATASCDV
jgi:hypothetical protein